jgi:hypothetical protein
MPSIQRRLISGCPEAAEPVTDRPLRRGHPGSRPRVQRWSPTVLLGELADSVLSGQVPVVLGIGNLVRRHSEPLKLSPNNG